MVLPKVTGRFEPRLLPPSRGHRLPELVTVRGSFGSPGSPAAELVDFSSLTSSFVAVSAAFSAAAFSITSSSFGGSVFPRTACLGKPSYLRVTKFCIYYHCYNLGISALAYMKRHRQWKSCNRAFRPFQLGSHSHPVAPIDVTCTRENSLRTGSEDR